jgi:hypothetical protein
MDVKSYTQNRFLRVLIHQVYNVEDVFVYRSSMPLIGVPNSQ